MNEPGAPWFMRSAFGRFEFFSGCLAFIRTAHYWTMLHPEIDTEDDMRLLMRGHEDLARLLLEDPEADRCEMGERLFEELTSLRELNERQELERAKQALEEKDRQKDQFIAVIAHELRNPLAAIRSATDAMRLMQMPDPGAARLVERLDRQITAMARMLDDLQDVSRTALGKVSVRLERVALPELLADVLNEQQPRARASGVAGDRAIPRQVLASSKQTAFGSGRFSIISWRTPSSSLRRAAPSSYRWHRKQGTPL